jgi:hypothetical protein
VRRAARGTLPRHGALVSIPPKEREQLRFDD